MCKDPEG